MKISKKVEFNKGRIQYGKRTQKQIELLRLLSQYLPINSIAKILNKSPKSVYKAFSHYVEYGWINKDRSLTSLGFQKVENYIGLSQKVESNDIRLHNIVVTFRLPKTYSYNELNKLLHIRKINTNLINKATHITNAIVIDNYKIWLDKSKLTIFMKQYIGKTPLDAFSSFLSDLESIIIKTEQILGLKLHEGKSLIFKISRNHYALVKNQLAEEYNKKGKKLFVYDDRNELRLLIDDSLSLSEFEAVHSKKAYEDSGKIQIHFKDLIENNPPTNSELSQHIMTLTNAIQETVDERKAVRDDLLLLAEQIKSHLALIQEYREENIKYRKDLEKKYKNET